MAVLRREMRGDRVQVKRVAEPRSHKAREQGRRSSHAIRCALYPKRQ